MKSDIICKIVIIGDSGVGKTCVMRRFTDDEFSLSFISTIGIDFKVRTLRIREKLVKVQIWDTAGQEKFRSITTAYYRGAHGIIIAYDITNRSSFDNVPIWIASVKQWTGAEAVGILIGTKCDIEQSRVIKKKEGEKIAKSHGLDFAETSAKKNVNIEHVFMKVLDQIVDDVRIDTVTYCVAITVVATKTLLDFK